MALHPPVENTELSDSLTKIAGLLLSEEKLEAVLELVVSLTSRTLPNADGVSVTLIRDGKFATAVYANEITRRVDEWQYATGEGPCLQAATDGELYLARDLTTDERWMQFGKMACAESVRCVLSIPFLPMGQPIGTLNIYSRQPDAFSETDIDTAKLFAEQAAIVIANSVAYSSAVVTNGQLRDALESREVIGRATGILMERERCTAEEAFDILKRVSQSTNRKLRTVAEGLVASVTGA